MPVQPVVSNSVNDVPSISLLGINKPEYLNVLVNRYGKQGMDYMSILKSFGYLRGTGQVYNSHFEDDWLHQTFVNKTTQAAGAAGAAVNVTLDASSLDANNDFFPQVTDDVMFPNKVIGLIIAIDVTTPTAPVLSIKPKRASDAIPALTAGQELVINSNSHSEGSGGRKSVMDRVIQDGNYLKIIKTDFEVTGSQMANGSTYFQGDTNGNKFAADYLRGQFNSEYRHLLAQTGAALFDVPVDNTSARLQDAATGRAFTGTEGLVPYIKRTGNIYPYTPGTLAVADKDAQSRILDKEFAGQYVMELQGNDLAIETENYLVDFLTPTQTSPAIVKQVSSEFFDGNEALGVSMEFTYLKKAQRIFMFKKLGILSHPQLYGAVGYDGPNLGILVPMKQNKVKMNNTSVSMPSIGCLYKEYNGYSRLAETVEERGANGNTNQIADTNKKEWRSEVGAYHTCGNQMILMEKI